METRSEPALARSGKGAQYLLHFANADLLIAGDVVTRQNMPHLHFITREGASWPAADPGITGALAFPVHFPGEFDVLLTGLTIAVMETLRDPVRRATLARFYAPIHDKLCQLLAAPPANFSADHKALLLYLLALSGHRSSDQPASQTKLETAAAYINEAEQIWTRQRAPLAWAMLQNSFAGMLTDVGEAEALDNAIGLFRVALEERTRNRAPLAWAESHVDLSVHPETP